MSNHEVGYNIPAIKGMSINDVQTPCLVIDYLAFTENINKMNQFCKANNVLLRPHAKMHKSVDIANYQLNYGGAHGICCQKVSEAELFAKSGIKDILITNQVCDQLKIKRLINISLLGGKIACCVDNFQNVIDIQAAAEIKDAKIGIYVEFECGSQRCGLNSINEINEIITLVKNSKNLIFEGIQAYNGSNQHIADKNTRLKAVLETNDIIRNLANQIDVKEYIITGGGTGCFEHEVNDNIYNEIQVGSYAFMDAHYSKVFNENKNGIHFRNSLFILTSVMSNNLNNFAIVDAGLKSQSVDSGLPAVFNNPSLIYTKCSDEHGIIEDKNNKLKINDKLFLVPGHCDPTCNLHDWYVVVENEVVKDVWPISARGFSY